MTACDHYFRCVRCGLSHDDYECASVGEQEDAARAHFVDLVAARAAHEDALGKLAIAMEGLASAALHARSAVKSWGAGQEQTVTHVRDVENAALVCEGVLAKIRGS